MKILPVVLLVLLWSSCANGLGEISAKYESGGLGVGAVSSGHNDPGGKSYGTHQLALSTGTLSAYISQSKFKSLLNKEPGSDKFDKQWKYLAERHSEAFSQDQLKFIAKTHFKPLRRVADKLNLKNDDRINEALFSMGVQHGKASKILIRASKKVNYITASVEVILRTLYAERSIYVKSLRLHISVKSAILRRYQSELIDILNL